MSFWITYIPDFSQPKHADKKFTFLKMPVSEEVSDKHFQKHYLNVERNEFNSEFITKVLNECDLEPVKALFEITTARETVVNKLLDEAVEYFKKVEDNNKDSAMAMLKAAKEYLEGAGEFAFKFKVYSNLHMVLSLGDKNTVISCISKAMRINGMYSYFVNVVRFIERRYKLAETIWD